jgi:hypothetical protein
MDGQGSDEPLLTRRNMHNARVPAEIPRMKQAQLKMAKITASHWYPPIQRNCELEQF